MMHSFYRWVIRVLAAVARDVQAQQYATRAAAAPDVVDTALKAAFSDCGLSADAYHPDFNLVQAGKLHEVLIHGARRLGHPLMTVSDVAELLR